MNTAQRILATPDRTLKERRNMAELRDIGYEIHGRVDHGRGWEVCYFRDRSALMMTFDEDLCPTEFLAINPPDQEEALNHALAAIDACEAQGVDYDEETLSHNIESGFPELDADQCDDIAAHAAAKQYVAPQHAHSLSTRKSE